MNLAEQFFLIIALLFLGLVAFKLFSSPLRLTMKVVGNTALGFAALAALDFFSPLPGLHVGVNLLNALVVGILGIPGLVLLLLSAWVIG